MEAVCILLGVKADWNTAKVMLADPQLVAKVTFITNTILGKISNRYNGWNEQDPSLPKFLLSVCCG